MTEPARTALHRAVEVMALLAFVALAVVGHASPWVEVEIPEEGQGTYEALHFITADEGWVLSLRDSGRERLRLDTFDGGETWDVQSIGEDEYRVLHRARFADPLNGWAHADLTGDLWFDRVDGHNPGEDNSIDAPVTFLRTWDGGRTWSHEEGIIDEVTYFGDEDLARDADRRYFSVVRFANEQVGIMAGILGAAREYESGRQYVVYRGHILLATRDGGATWGAHMYGDQSPDDWVDPTWGPTTAIESIAMVDDQYVRIPANGGEVLHFFRSDDAGRTWEALDGNPRNGVAPTFGTRVSFATPSNGWSWRHTSGPTFTRDGGRTWELSTGPAQIGFHAASDSELWGVNGEPVLDADGIVRSAHAVQHSADGGATWTREYLTPQLGGITRWETLGTVKYDSGTRTLWAYGFRALLARRGITAAAGVGDSVPTQWARLRMEGPK